jgi:regulator of nucleoside diphosphate kinase
VLSACEHIADADGRPFGAGAATAAATRPRRSQDAEMSRSPFVDRKTSIYIAEEQLEQLQHVADLAASPVGDLLRQEVDRAIVLTHEDSPTTFVRLNSLVEYMDLLSGRTRRLALVVPQEADVDQGRVSVVTPVGAALLGLVPGLPFSWTAADGQPHALVVLKVEERS